MNLSVESSLRVAAFGGQEDEGIGFSDTQQPTAPLTPADQMASGCGVRELDQRPNKLWPFVQSNGCLEIEHYLDSSVDMEEVTCPWIGWGSLRSFPRRENVA